MSFNNLLLLLVLFSLKKWGKSKKKLNIATFYVVFLQIKTFLKWN